MKDFKQYLKPNNAFLHILMTSVILICFRLSCMGQTLDELKVIAAEQNLELKAQYNLVEAQVESVNQAKSWQDPNLSFGYFISPIETRVGPQIARFSLTQMLPWFGTYKVKGEIAALKAEAEFQKFQNKKLQLFLKVAEYYYDYLALDYKELIEEQQLSVLDDIKAIVESQYENNQARLIDVYRVDLDIAKQTNALKIIGSQKATILAKLNQLMNRSVSHPIIIDNSKRLLENMTSIESFDVTENHPRIESLKLLKATAQANKTLVRKQNKPQFGIGVDYAIIQDKNVQNPDAGQDAIMPMLSLSLPIFGKKNASKRKVASLQEESIELDLQNEIKSMSTEIDIAVYKKSELRDHLSLNNIQLQKLDDMLHLAESALANLNIDLGDVLELQQQRLVIEKQRIKTLTEIHKNQETLNYLTLNNQL